MYLLDTTFLIDCLDSKDKFLNELIELSVSPLFVSVISIAELFSNTSENQIDKIKNFLESFTILPLTQEIAIKAGLTRAELTKCGYKKLLPDILIGQTAIEHNLILVTGNPKDFPQLRARKQLMPFPD